MVTLYPSTSSLSMLTRTEYPAGSPVKRARLYIPRSSLSVSFNFLHRTSPSTGKTMARRSIPLGTFISTVVLRAHGFSSEVVPRTEIASVWATLVNGLLHLAGSGMQVWALWANNFVRKPYLPPRLDSVFRLPPCA
jgi:hypothetical protein